MFGHIIIPRQKHPIFGQRQNRATQLGGPAVGGIRARPSFRNFFAWEQRCALNNLEIIWR